MPKPKKSNAPLDLALGAKANSMAKAIVPTGKLTRNTQRQLNVSVSQPPSVGPMIGATMIPAP